MTNDFLVFGGDGAANVISQADYALLGARLTGFQSGVAQSAQLNKAWRQSSIMAAVLAQFVADITGQNVVDDGSVATILANLKAAVRAQSMSVAGAASNVRMRVLAASATATLTADEIVVETVLGGLRYCLANFNKTINLATTGAGGMDVGTAPASGYVALYAIYNPSSGATALLATNATNAAAPNVYGGANMPGGYTASALVSAWPTNGSGQLVVGLQIDRRIGITDSNALTTSSTIGTPQTLNISGSVPPNAKFCSGQLVCNNTVPSLSGTMSLVVYDSDLNVGSQSVVGAAVGLRVPFARVAMNTPQTIRWSSTNNSGTPTFIITISSYDI